MAGAHATTRKAVRKQAARTGDLGAFENEGPAQHHRAGPGVEANGDAYFLSGERLRDVRLGGATGERGQVTFTQRLELGDAGRSAFHAADLSAGAHVSRRKLHPYGKANVSPRVLVDITRNNLFGREQSASLRGSLAALRRLRPDG